MAVWTVRTIHRSPVSAGPLDAQGFKLGDFFDQARFGTMMADKIGDSGTATRMSIQMMLNGNLMSAAAQVIGMPVAMALSRRETARAVLAARAALGGVGSVGGAVAGGAAGAGAGAAAAQRVPPA